MGGYSSVGSKALRGFDKIAEGDFGRCSAAATVRSEAEDERRSREQSLGSAIGEVANLVTMMVISTGV